jgi:hypothetical protein
MEFNTTFIRDANSVFTSHDSSSDEDQLIKELSLENNNVFNRFLVTKVGDDEIEVPVIAREHIEQAVSDVMSPLTGASRIQTVVLPLYENSAPQERRTFDSFIRQFFVTTNYSRRLQKITSNKGEVYYGGKGLIFDSRYNPLIMCTLKARKQVQESGTFRMAYFKPVIYVNPIVFLESDKLINKGIIKKLIPYYTSRDIDFPRNNYRFSSNPEDRKVKVIVDNFNKFFVEPIKPTPSATTNDALNECLIDNIDDIMMLI